MTTRLVQDIHVEDSQKIRQMESVKSDFMSLLPPEIIVDIYREMEGRDVTCKRLFAISADRSVWTGLLRVADEDCRLRLDGPVDNYSTLELQKHVLRQISTELGWKSTRKPVERCASDNCEIGAYKILLEGGRWLLTFDSDLHMRNSVLPWPRTSVHVYDLNRDDVRVHEIYRLSLEDPYRLRYVTAQLEAVDNDLTFNIALIMVMESGPDLKIQIIQMKQQGRGLDATPIILTPFPPIFLDQTFIMDAPCMQGDFFALKFDDAIVVPLHPRTETAVLAQDFDHDEVYSTSSRKQGTVPTAGYNWVVVYECAKFQRQSSDNPIDEVHEDPREFWKTKIDSLPQLYQSMLNFSEPYNFESATRLTLRINERIYGVIIPHDDATPTLFLLATSPDLLNVYEEDVTLGLTKVFIAPKRDSADFNACTLTFPWPNNELDMAKWQPPSLSCIGRHFEVCKSLMGRGPNVLDDASGCIVMGSKYEDSIRGGRPPQNERWEDIIPWAIVDFCAPQYLPHSYQL